MRLALCTGFLDGGVWGERLQAVDIGISVIDEYDSAEELLRSIAVYDAVVVALKGVAGLQAVRTLWEAGNSMPLLWIADEEEYAHFAYRYQVTFFLTDAEGAEALSNALVRVKEATE